MDLTESQISRLAELSAGRAAAPRLRDGTLSLVLDVGDLPESTSQAMIASIEAEFSGIPGITAVRIAQTAERKMRQIIAVASGKGGVGKSTVSANLAVALHKLGVRVGLVDADILGPSQHKLMATEGQRPKANDKQMIPVVGAGNVPMLSMGQLVDPGQAIAWRGSMATSAMGQMLDARWGDVELLIVDMPPGTGDIQLTMVQKYKPAGAVIVSTPQDLALIDATRAISLFDQVKVPVIGLVENMAGYACPHCGAISDPFGQGGAESAARERDLPFLGRIPLSMGIRAASDAGAPPAAGAGDDAEPFFGIARGVKAWLDKLP